MAKLVDILAEKLKHWPVLSGGCESITQDGDGELNATLYGKSPYTVGSVWAAMCSQLILDENEENIVLELAEDHQTAIVTKKQWQYVVAALKMQDQVQESLIKSLEQRIKDRAIERLSYEVEDGMRQLLILAGGFENHPSGVGDMTIGQMIDAAGAAIMKARSPEIADYALKSIKRALSHANY